MNDLRCTTHTPRGECHRLLGKADGEGSIEIKCPSCKQLMRFELAAVTPMSSAA